MLLDSCLQRIRATQQISFHPTDKNVFRQTFPLLWKTPQENSQIFYDVLLH